MTPHEPPAYTEAQERAIERGESIAYWRTEVGPRDRDAMSNRAADAYERDMDAAWGGA